MVVQVHCQVLEGIKDMEGVVVLVSFSSETSLVHLPLFVVAATAFFILTETVRDNPKNPT